MLVKDFISSALAGKAVVGALSTEPFSDKAGLLYGAISMRICQSILGGVLGSYASYLSERVGENETLSHRLPHQHLAWSFSCPTSSSSSTPSTWAQWPGCTARRCGGCFGFAPDLLIPHAFHDISWKRFIMFMVRCCVRQFSLLLYTETTRKSLEEIESLFSKRGPRLWHIGPDYRMPDGKIAQAE